MTPPDAPVPAPVAHPAPDRRSLPVQVAEALIDAVVAGRYPPGTTLPPERELAGQLGINRTSLRQAIARVEQTGLVESRQGIGTVVRDPLRSSDSGIVLRALAVAGPDVVAELLEVRAALAELAGRLAAQQGAGATDVLDARLDDVRGAVPGSDLQAAELAFFSALVDQGGNRPLRVMMGWLEELYGATAPLFVDAFGSTRTVVSGLVPVADAVRRGDASAAETAAGAYAQASGRRLLAAVRRGLAGQRAGS